MATTPQDVNRLLVEQERIDDDIVPLTDEAALRRRVVRQVKKSRDLRTHFVIYLVMNLVFLVFFTALEIPWVAGIIAMSWGSGLAAQAVDVHYDTGKRAAERLARMHQAYRDAYGPRWYENATRAQLIEVRRQTDEPIKKRAALYEHVAVYTLINLMLWLIYFAVMPGSIPWPLLVMGLWGIGLGANVADTYSGGRQNANIDREVERQRALIEQAQWGGEKPKNDFLEADDEPAMTVGPDGELVEDADESDDEAKQKRSR
ncbi:MAG: 2TM domain-containing protein [Anaerolineae bacterium]